MFREALGNDPAFWFVAWFFAAVAVTAITGVLSWLLHIVIDLALWIGQVIRARREEREIIRRMRAARSQVAAWQRSIEWRRTCPEWDDRQLPSDDERAQVS